MSLDISSSSGSTHPDPVPATAVPGLPEREPTQVDAREGESFAEVALRLGGASADEASRTGVIDSADDQVEDLFAEQYKTVNSPVHRAVWENTVDTDTFVAGAVPHDDDVQAVVNRSLAVVQQARDADRLFDDRGKVSDSVFKQLANAGYWGLLVDKEFGGSGASMRQFAKMITRMSMIDPTVAGLASVHGCIGAVDPVRSFGNEDQKRRFLPGLADGSRLSAFALTEPGAGSDLTALKTTATLDGDHYVVNGEKLFITNATFGRTIGLVCKIDGVPSVLVAELPEQETEQFRINRYQIFALRRAENNGLVFKNFRVPAANRLMPTRGDGLTIAYHGLNLGRVSLCANAAGAMRWMLAEMLPWAAYRSTYGQAIDRRELVRRRIGHLAGLIVAADALTDWCAWLLDEGYRGEMECIVAKIFGSEAQKEAAIELFMKTHGGRSFLQGHLFGDNVHDFLAPCIYEGEGEMLAMAFFKSLVKDHGKRFFEPIGRTLHDLGVRRPNFTNPKHVWALRGPMAKYTAWYSAKCVRSAYWEDDDVLRDCDESMLKHIRFAQRYLSDCGVRISDAMRRYQLKLADRQCRMTALSAQVQDAVTILVTALYASRHSDPLTRQAADAVCRRLRRRITGGLPTDSEFRQVTKLGEQIASTGWSELDGTTAGRILQSY
ncbi:acyl-CoA dehydrogenase family protein [Rhodopirellula sp. MGV]|uniref:acyl-CoA dehydrogenase family protein n=1 Tax=Rhodopirellula sp. MGV TaxID=2023130 RepID=UPI000B96CB79|nr:acyl-CoA dehydrogenase family protein [Rhodopirellula sp. MGV]OYP32371.1 acyl-CoA dehydrogenase [Rhodopirellula sp. MGV]PNY35845.1 acyl-CoA dehydrogenase [Rhodopirellula baltica]